MPGTVVLGVPRRQADDPLHQGHTSMSGGPLDEFTGARAGEAADGLLTALRVVVRAGGRSAVPGVVVELVHALHAAAEAHSRCSASGTGSSGPGILEDVGTAWIASGEASRRVGCSTGYVRRLARTGRISARRVGRDWQVDPASLDAHFRRGAA